MGVVAEYDNDEYFTTDNIDLSGNDELTICCFAQFESFPSGPPRYVCSAWGTSLNQNWALAGDTRVQFRVATGTSSASYITTGVILSANTWYHIAGVYNGSNMYIYVDGDQKQTGSLTGNVRNVAGSETALFTDPKQATTRNIDGELYDIRLYNRALSVDEINKIYLSNGADAIHNGLVARWLLNEFAPGVSISGTDVVKDIVGGYHGTAVNTPTGGTKNASRRKYS